jgi:hypothetical protein
MQRVPTNAKDVIAYQVRERLHHSLRVTVVLQLDADAIYYRHTRPVGVLTQFAQRVNLAAYMATREELPVKPCQLRLYLLRLKT